ncbi:MAG TPA: flagellar type III secretion system pore protein FliP [Phycisphaerales bacterium]|nr:flagellar type III secretion system pore protein FliP [Phycisphaerales bacterium]
MRRIAVIAALTLVAPFALAQGRIGPPLPEYKEPAPVREAAPDGSAAAALPATLTNPIEVLASAGENLPGAKTGAAGKAGGLSTALNVMLLLTVVALAPSIMLMTTCFMRILVVLGLVRQALGVQSVPPPQVITALALFMTLLVMTPTIDRINSEAIAPYREGKIENYDQLWDKAKQPVRDFMFAQIEATGNWSSLYMVMEQRGVDVSDPSKLKRADADMITLVPAFMLSELKAAFLMGFRVYLPFLVIDMVVSTMLIAMGMMMLPPVLVSLPFKLLLFVLVDGWTLVVGGLMASFAQPVTGVEHAALLPAVESVQHAASTALCSFAGLRLT